MATPDDPLSQQERTYERAVWLEGLLMDMTRTQLERALCLFVAVSPDMAEQVIARAVHPSGGHSAPSQRPALGRHLRPVEPPAP